MNKYIYTCISIYLSVYIYIFSHRLFQHIVRRWVSAGRHSLRGSGTPHLQRGLRGSGCRCAKGRGRGSWSVGGRVT